MKWCTLGLVVAAKTWKGGTFYWINLRGAARRSGRQDDAEFVEMDVAVVVFDEKRERLGRQQAAEFRAGACKRLRFICLV